MAQQWNVRNPAVKRILQELREIQRDDNPDIAAEAVEDNIFEWNFAIRGAWDTEFEGGIYHGRILLPADYPFKPPSFVMLSPSGRFDTGTKICLSISSHHPESWQPSWSVRSALVALVAFMQTPGNGAIGSLDHPADVRRLMAAEARAKAPCQGSEARQRLIDELHQRMLDQEPASRRLFAGPAPSAQDEAAGAGAATATAEQPGAAKPEVAAGDAAGGAAGFIPASIPGADAAVAALEAATPTLSAAATPEAAAPTPPAAAAPVAAAAQEAAAPSPVAVAAPVPRAPAAAPQEAAASAPPRPAPELRQRRAAPAAARAAPVALVQQESWEDRGLTCLAAALGVAIVCLLLRKVAVAMQFDVGGLES